MDQTSILTNPEDEKAERTDLLSIFSQLSTIKEDTNLTDILSKHTRYVDAQSAITVIPPESNNSKLDIKDIIMLNQRRRTPLPPRNSLVTESSVSAEYFQDGKDVLVIDYDPRNSIRSSKSLSIKPEDPSNQSETSEITQETDESKTCSWTGYVYNPKEESYRWPTISEFHSQLVPVLVKKYIECWKLDPVFKFHILPFERKKCTYSNLYGAEVIFSAPTPSCPNPQFNVSVYFKFEVSKVAPKTLPVHVSYHFEGQRQVHIADNRFTFQEGVLILLMKCKMKIFSELRF